MGSWSGADPWCWEHPRPRSCQECVSDPKDDRVTPRGPQGHSSAQETPRKTHAPAAPTASQGHACPHGGPRGLVHGVGTLPAWSPKQLVTRARTTGRVVGREATVLGEGTVRLVSFLHRPGSCLRPIPAAACGRPGFISLLVAPCPPPEAPRTEAGGAPARSPRSPLHRPEESAGPAGPPQDLGN